MATSDKLQEYRAFTHTLKKMMFLVGLWPVAKPNLFYRILPILSFIASVIACSVIFNFVWINHSDIETMTKGMGLGGSFITTILKILCIMLNWEDVKELHETLDNIFNELLDETIIQSLVLKKITVVRQLSNTFSYLVLLSIVTYSVTPISHVIHQYIHHIHPITYILPLPAVYPWSIPGGSFSYYIHFICEAFCGYVLLLVTCSVDAFFPMYIFQMSGQLQAMSYQLNKMTNGKDDYNGTIQECAKKYQVLLRCRDIIETIYGPIILWMLLSSSIVLCALTFQLSKLEGFAIGRICLFVAYMGSKMLQTFIYAWSGSLLTSESEIFTEAIYASDWPGTGHKRFMSSILIMLTQKPLVITACGYSVVSIDMFAMILNTTVSYFFLLRAMEDKAA